MRILGVGAGELKEVPGKVGWESSRGPYLGGKVLREKGPNYTGKSAQLKKERPLIGEEAARGDERECKRVVGEGRELNTWEYSTVKLSEMKGKKRACTKRSVGEKRWPSAEFVLRPAGEIQSRRQRRGMHHEHGSVFSRQAGRKILKKQPQALEQVTTPGKRTREDYEGREGASGGVKPAVMQVLGGTVHGTLRKKITRIKKKNQGEKGRLKARRGERALTMRKQS